MRLPRTITKLKAALPGMVAGLASDTAHAADAGLSELDATFDNPGNLRARMFVPETLANVAPLVVVLHGCTQTAADYDQGSGWSQLAQRHGFALLYPEQSRSNNPNGCFNWFSPGDIRRGEGEAASIAGMTEAMVAAHAIDRTRVFVTGLSAGGAMAGAMLATYPDLFAGGAIIAGLPYGCASGVGEALACMSGRGMADSARTLGDHVRGATPYTGPWPRVGIWHGTADRTVVPGNGDALVRQWTDVHGFSETPTRTDVNGPRTHRLWSHADDVPRVEQHVIEGLGHGTPLRPGTEPGQAGEARAHMLDVGISSTDEIACFFGVGPVVAKRDHARAMEGDRAGVAGTTIRSGTFGVDEGPHEVIEDALRAAGLMR